MRLMMHDLQRELAALREENARLRSALAAAAPAPVRPHPLAIPDGLSTVSTALPLSPTPALPDSEDTPMSPTRSNSSPALMPTDPLTGPRAASGANLELPIAKEHRRSSLGDGGRHA